METVKEMQKRHQEEVNSFEGLFFAFNNKQLEEGMEKVGLEKDAYKEIVSVGAGGYLRKDRRQAFVDMFTRQAEERKEARRLQKTIKIKFRGIDNFNHAVFKTIESINGRHSYFGSVNTLFNYEATEKEVLEKISEDDLVYFGNSFGCEPMGTHSGNIEILTPDAND